MVMATCCAAGPDFRGKSVYAQNNLMIKSTLNHVQNTKIISVINIVQYNMIIRIINVVQYIVNKIYTFPLFIIKNLKQTLLKDNRAGMNYSGAEPLSIKWSLPGKRINFRPKGQGIKPHFINKMNSPHKNIMINMIYKSLIFNNLKIIQNEKDSFTIGFISKHRNCPEYLEPAVVETG
jgi:hypothetical protein